MAQGIKESLELLQGVKDLVIDVKAVLADGKVSLADLPILMNLIGQFPELSAAVEGDNLILPELKDLDVEEANQLMAKALEIVQAFKS